MTFIWLQLITILKSPYDNGSTNYSFFLINILLLYGISILSWLTEIIYYIINTLKYYNINNNS